MMYIMSADRAEVCHTSTCSATIRTEIGRRVSQQDRALICCDENLLFAFLCDGMGGTAQGEMASQRTAETLCDLFSEPNTYEMALKQPIDFLHLALTNSDEAVACDAGLYGSGTTLTALILAEKQAYWASVGDSRLYIMRKNEMVQATRDHNYQLYLDELLSQKRIGQQRYDAERARGRALISYIGIGHLQLFDLTKNPLPVLPGDMLLLTSDGLTGLLSEQEIQAVLQSDGTLDQRADRLMQSALLKGQERSMDNTTFILTEII